MDTYSALRHFADSWALLALALVFLGAVAFAATRSVIVALRRARVPRLERARALGDTIRVRAAAHGAEQQARHQRGRPGRHPSFHVPRCNSVRCNRSARHELHFLAAAVVRRQHASG